MLLITKFTMSSNQSLQKHILAHYGFCTIQKTHALLNKLITLDLMQHALLKKATQNALFMLCFLTVLASIVHLCVSSNPAWLSQSGETWYLPA